MRRTDFFPAFRSRRNFYGYAWITGVSQGGEKDPERRWLVERRPTRGGPIIIGRGYDLTEHPMLFHIFAEKPPTEEGILHFAQTYGGLGVKEDCWVSEEARQVYVDLIDRWQKAGDNRGGIGEELARLHLSGERLSTWLCEISSMKCAIALWRALQTRDNQWLHTYINMEVPQPPFESTTARVRYSFIEKGIYASASGMFTFPVPPTTKEDLVRMLRAHEIIQIGWSLLGDLINHRLSRHTGHQMVFAANEQHLRLQTVPKNLLGALWLQLARSVDGDKTYLACEGGCGTLLEIDLGTGYRTNRRACSDACRQKAYRERQRRAHQLATQGMTVEAIAHTLGTKIKTAQQWLAKPPPSLEPRGRGRPRTQRTGSASSASEISTLLHD